MPLPNLKHNPPRQLKVFLQFVKNERRTIAQRALRRKFNAVARKVEPYRTRVNNEQPRER